MENSIDSGTRAGVPAGTQSGQLRASERVERLELVLQATNEGQVEIIQNLIAQNPVRYRRQILGLTVAVPGSVFLVLLSTRFGRLAASLGERRQLVIVDVEGRRFLLGVTQSTVALVTELQPAPPVTEAPSEWG